VRGLSGLIRFRQTACYVCMCKVMLAGAGYMSDLTDIFTRHRTEPSSPKLPASNHTLGPSNLSRLTETSPSDIAPTQASLLARPDSPACPATRASSQGDVGPSPQVGRALTMALRANYGPALDVNQMSLNLIDTNGHRLMRTPSNLH